MIFKEGESDKTIICFTNNGRYELKIIARLDGSPNAQYYIVLKEPDEEQAVGYMATIEQFRNIGFMLMAFSKFAEDKIVVTDTNDVTKAVISEGLNRKTVIKYAIDHGLHKEFQKVLKYCEGKYCGNKD